MRRLLAALAIIASVLFVAAPRARADVQPALQGPTSLSSGGSSCVATNCVSANLIGQSSVGISVTGTFVATLVVECTTNGPFDATQNWSQESLIQRGGAGSISSITAPADGTAGCVSGQQIRVRVSAYTSGNPIVTIYGTAAVRAMPIGSHGGAAVEQATGSPAWTSTLQDQAFPGQSLALTGTSCPTNCLAISTVGGKGSVTIQIDGLTGTGAVVTFERSGNSGTTYNTVPAVPAAATVNLTTTSSDGQYLVQSGGASNVRVHVTTPGTGTATVSLNASASSSAVVLAGAIPFGNNNIGTVVLGAGSNAVGTFNVGNWPTPGPTTAASAPIVALCDKTTLTQCVAVDANGVIPTKVCDKTTTTQCVSVDSAGNVSINVGKFGGSSVAIGQATMANSIPVVIASNQTSLNVAQSGLWTVQPGNTANTTAWLFKLCDPTTQTQCMGVSAGGVASVSTPAPAPTGAHGAVQIEGVASGTVVPVSTPAPAPTGAHGAVQIEGVASGTTVPVTGTITAVTSITNALPAGTNLLGQVGEAAVTGNGATRHTVDTLTTNVVTAICASACTGYALSVINTTGAACFVQQFNTAAGSVTLGTTPPVRLGYVPASAEWADNIPPTVGIKFSTAWSYAVTTTATGSTACGSTAYGQADWI